MKKKYDTVGERVILGSSLRLLLTLDNLSLVLCVNIDFCQAQGQGQHQTSKVDPEIVAVMGWPTTHPATTRQLFLSRKLLIMVR